MFDPHHTKSALKRSIFIGVLFCGALLYPCLVVFFSECTLGNDSGQYYAYAKNFLETGVYGLTPGLPDAHREPLYSLVLAAFMGPVRLAGIYMPETIAPWLVFFQSLLCYVACAAVLTMRAFSLRRRMAFFALLLLSPTVVTMNGMVYSETLAYSLVTLFLVLFFRALDEPSPWKLLAAFLFGACLVLTKMHFQYLPFLLLPVASGTLAAGRMGRIGARARRGAWLLVCFSLGILVSFQAWNARNGREFHGSGASYRKFLNTLGKAMRSDSVDFSTETAPALAAALGSNFCERSYGLERCAPFDFRTSDGLANGFIQKAVRQESDEDKLAREIKGKILAYWRERPSRQVLGSLLEAARISFFEFTDIGRSSSHAWLSKFPSAWHFLGSVLLWLACLWGGGRWRRMGAPLQLSAGVCLLLIAYHYAIYVHVTNVARFSLVILPPLYFLAYFPIAQSLASAPRRRAG